MKRLSLYVICLMVTYYDIDSLISYAGVNEKDGPPSITRDPFINVPPAKKINKEIEDRSKSDIDHSGSKINSHLRKAEKVLRDNKVKGIIMNWDRPLALLNHRIVAVGDRIEDYTITFIDRNGVLISDGKNVIQLPLE